jgi:hypothetical protein
MPQFFWRKCKCVESAQRDSLRFVNIVFKENKKVPMIGAPHEWADGNCPTCKGRGAILEQADTEKDINAMFADFRKKMACPK